MAMDVTLRSASPPERLFRHKTLVLMLANAKEYCAMLNLIAVLIVIDLRPHLQEIPVLSDSSDSSECGDPENAKSPESQRWLKSNAQQY